MCDQRTVDGREAHAGPRHIRGRCDGGGILGDAGLRREDHREPVRPPGRDAALGGGARKRHVQGGRPRHRRHHRGCGRRDVVAQHAGRRIALCRDRDLGGDRRVACRRRAQGAGFVLEPHRRAGLGGKARCRHRVDQGSRGQEGRLYQSEVDHRDGDPHRAQAGGPRRQGRGAAARRPRPRADRARAGRGRGGAVERSGADGDAGQIQGAVLRPPVLSQDSPGRWR